ncbi:ATP-binding protein [Spirosoma sp. RP8]|uniref:histidine kinase n=1 Tax=Spirosoma liriopis TaxID=2937440 RepID=A0ABT0HIN6_9BACT|nr:ATP-binding protein [Spirosoma liriopis]MCK8492028.1 ATP-binding protein [Spirosoma liriopis]
MNLPLRTRYLIYIMAVHLVLLALMGWILRENKALFIASEVLILISAYVAVRIYRAFQQPAEFITSGIEAIRDKDFSIKFVQTGNREVDELITVYNLMIDQLRQERTRQAEQQFFLDKLIEAAPIAILVFDFDDRIASINPRACQLLSVHPNDVIGKQLADLGYSLLAHIADLVDGDSRIMKPNGIETYKVLRSNFVDRGFRRSFLIIEELTPEILATEKNAYSKVIRMMAHEVNNSIGAVNSILNIAEPELSDPDLRSAVQVAIDRNERLNRFMRRFADVVRLPTPHLLPGDVTELACNVVRLMQPQAEAQHVTLTLTSPSIPVTQPMDVGQLEQVLVNIIKNAIEACKAGQMVEVQVKVSQLLVRNNGAPISDEIAVKLFNPFFSTRPTGQGIGLTLTREILLNHGFTFSLQTESDGWTVFAIAW